MTGLDRREYSRVDAFLTLRTRQVPPEEREHVRSRSSIEFASTKFPPLPDPGDEILAECMNIINAKLDAILNFLSARNNELASFVPLQVNISGSGLSFDTVEQYKVGDLLEIKMLCPTSPDTLFYIYGEVVKSGQIEDKIRRLSVRFTEIDEDIRDSIVKFVFEKQREDIRKKRRQ